MAKKVKLRSLLFGVFFTLLFLGILFRLYILQVVDSPVLLSKAERMWKSHSVIDPERGLIEDRNGNTLADDTNGYTVAVLPKTIHKLHIENMVVQKLAPVLHISETKLMDIVTAKRSNGQYYDQREIRNEGWKIDQDEADKVKQVISDIQMKLNLEHVGIVMLPETLRTYPGGALAAHVLGYTNKSGHAIMGLEYYYNNLLKGSPGTLSFQKDGRGVELPNSKVIYHPAVNGKTLKLTLDEHIQLFMQSALEKVYNQYHPVGITAVAVDPKTMNILAMASLPTFNPNKYWNYASQSVFINHAIASAYEPGSTFKVVTLTGTVQEGIFHPNEKYQSGRVKVSGQYLYDWDRYGWGKISFMQGLERSSNVAFVKLGYFGLGMQKLKQYIEKFGFGTKTGIDLPSEVSGQVSMHYPIEYATATYGQGKITATPLQMIQAYAAVANGGLLMQPHLLHEVLDPTTGKVLQEIKPKVTRRIVPESIANKVKNDLRNVVTSPVGTAHMLNNMEYSVAGKSGTAQIVSKGDAGYSKDKYYFSFVGFAPVSDPKILVGVFIDQPNASFHEGGVLAQDVFRQTVHQSLQYMNVQPQNDQAATRVESQVPLTKVPDVTGTSAATAKNVLQSAGLGAVMLGNGSRVLHQFPKPKEQIDPHQKVFLLTDTPDKLSVPDLHGMSLRNALEVCGLLQVKCESEGAGYVLSQSVSGSGTDRVVQLKLVPYTDLNSTADPTNRSAAQGDAAGDTAAGSVQNSAGASNGDASSAADAQSTG